MTSKRLLSNSFADIFSVVVVGDKLVGKTTFIRKLMESKEVRDSDLSFRKSINPYMFYEMCFDYESSQYLFQIYDTPSNLNDIKKQYMRLLKKADAIIIMCAVNDKSSFNSLRDWVAMINNFTSCTSYTSVSSDHSLCNKTHSHVYIINNKIDLVEERVIGIDELKQISEEFNVKYFEVSAKNGDAVLYSFTHIFKYVIQNIYKNSQDQTIVEQMDDTQHNHINNSTSCSKCFCSIF